MRYRTFAGVPCVVALVVAAVLASGDSKHAPLDQQVSAVQHASRVPPVFVAEDLASADLCALDGQTITIDGCVTRSKRGVIIYNEQIQIDMSIDIVPSGTTHERSRVTGQILFVRPAYYHVSPNDNLKPEE